jgi:branched-chain amino acid transport system substrate-binding protein
MVGTLLGSRDMTRAMSVRGVVAVALGALLVALALLWRGNAPARAQALTAVTIYSSLPLQGDSRALTQDIVSAEKLALSDAGGTAGGLAIKFISLDDSTAAAGKWEPGQTFDNARTAARDRKTIAYLGEFNSGASAISILPLNETGIPQVSPTNTYVGLTRSEAADVGEPDRYYPTGVRTYARVAQADHIQAVAIAKYLRVLRVRRVFLVHDNEIYGKGIARLVRSRARAAGIRVVGFRAFDGRGSVGGGLVRAVRRSRASAVFFGGITDNGAPRLFDGLHARLPRLRLLGPDGVAEEAFTRRLSRGARARTRITDFALRRPAFGAAGRRFVMRFEARYHHAPGVYAIYGYEAMSLVLDAMNRAAPRANDRTAVLAAIFATRKRASVLGRYSIDANGDTTLPRYTTYKVSRHGRLRYDRTLRLHL